MSKIRTGIKIRVTPEQSKKIQEICFANSIHWLYSANNINHLREPFLFIDSVISFADRDQERSFLKNNNEEVSAELFIRTNGSCTEYNNKGEQMEELKIECLIEGYEGTYFEVGQIWETRDGINKAKIIEILTEKEYPIYPILCEYYNKAEDRNFEFNVDKYGKYTRLNRNRLDLVKLVSTETPTESTPSETQLKTKTFSDYLKESGAYESFVENCVEALLKDLAWYEAFKKDGKMICFNNVFTWYVSNEGYSYWNNLYNNEPDNLIYDMNEIIITEVDKRIAEQNPPKRYMVFVEGRSNPKVIHDCIASARREASRLSAKEVGLKVSVVEIICEFKSKVTVEEV